METKCKISWWSSRCCERGTRGCVVQHVFVERPYSDACPTKFLDMSPQTIKDYGDTITFLARLLVDANNRLDKFYRDGGNRFIRRDLLEQFKTRMELVFADAGMRAKNVDDKQVIQVAYERFEALIGELLQEEEDEG